MAEDLHAEVWAALGGSDPDWAVATDPARRGGGWLQDLDAFYASGTADVEELLAGLPPGPRSAALDYGSGTGRLTFALATRCSRVTALDVSPAMLGRLTARAQERRVEGVEPTLVRDFVPAGDHDLAVSLLVLQHLADRDAVRDALRLMVAALRPGGWLVVEAPVAPRTVRARWQPRFHLYRVLRRSGVPAAALQRRGLSGISMLTLSEAWVRAALVDAGCPVQEVTTRRDASWTYARYAARRSGA